MKSKPTKCFFVHYALLDQWNDVTTCPHLCPFSSSQDKTRGSQLIDKQLYMLYAVGGQNLHTEPLNECMQRFHILTSNICPYNQL